MTGAPGRVDITSLNQGTLRLYRLWVWLRRLACCLMHLSAFHLQGGILQPHFQPAVRCSRRQVI